MNASAPRESSSAAPRGPWLPYLLPVLLWVALIALLSSNLIHINDLLSLLVKTAQRLFPNFAQLALLNRLNLALWKAGHVAAYFVLSLLLWRLWQRGQKMSWRWLWAFRTLAVGLLLGGLNELFQYFSPPRKARASDIALDAAGILLALALLRRRVRHARASKATG